MSTSFRISMDGAQQNPAVATAASGLGTAIYDSVAGTLEYTIFVTGLDYGPIMGQPAQTADPGDDVILNHFHNEARGANGPVVFDWMLDTDFTATLLPDGSWVVQGIWDLAEQGGSLTTFVAALAGASPGADVPLYANIHTNEFGGGEIRGQLVGLSTDGNETLKGTTGNDILPGLGGADKIRGFEGVDLLIGGKGPDKFVFESKLALLNADTVQDFRHNTDEIRLDEDIFKQLDRGALDADAFLAVRGATTLAQDDEDRILYNKTSGAIFFDKDGVGGAVAKLFAQLQGSPDAVNETDFLVIA